MTRGTHAFESVESQFPFTTISLVTRTHVWTSANDDNGVGEPARDKWVRHPAFRDGLLPLRFAFGY
jgi:hypothetical protein